MQNSELYISWAIFRVRKIIYIILLVTWAFVSCLICLPSALRLCGYIHIKQIPHPHVTVITRDALILPAKLLE